MELEPNQINEQMAAELEESSKYNVDIVIAIDVTGSMMDMIEDTKQTAISFATIMEEQMQELNKPLNDLRVKLIGFRDYHNDNEAMVQSEGFFDLPEEQNELEEFVMNLEAHGGGPNSENIPESGLEALYLSLQNTEWTDKPNGRHVVTVITDAPPRELTPDPIEHKDYPKNMPGSLEELEDCWNNKEMIGQAEKRLILFAPELDEKHVLIFNDLWHQVGKFENTHWIKTKATQGLAETDLREVIRAICESIGGNSVTETTQEEETGETVSGEFSIEGN